MSKNESLLDVFVLIYKWRKRIILSTFLAGVITAGVSLLLPNYYQASTQFYAASPDLAKPTPLGVSENTVRIYGNDNDIDRLLSISRSNEVKDFLITEFDLYKQYEIKPESKHAKHKLLLKLDKLYKATKTKFDAINLSVEDKDINISASMANAARDKIEEVARNLIKENHLNQINSYKSNISIKQANINGLTDSLFSIRKRFKIFNTASQGEAYGSSLVSIKGKVQNTSAQISILEQLNAPQDSILILKAKLKGYQTQLNGINEDISSYNNGYPTIITIERDLKNYAEQLSIDKERLKQLESTYNSNFNTIHIIEKAETPVYKSRPKRSIIVIGVAFLIFVLSCLTVILLDQFNKNNWREEFRNA